MSRSPPRFDGRRTGSRGNSFTGKARSNVNATKMGRNNGLPARAVQQSVGKREKTPDIAAPSKVDAEQTETQAPKGVSFTLGAKPGSNAEDKCVPHRSARLLTDPSILDSEEAPAQKTTVAATTEPVDEATLIEQRRKRRDAIMAKHKAQSNPLLVQALTTSNLTTPSDSLPETPSSASPAIGKPGQAHATILSQLTFQDLLHISPPSTPRDGSGANSPNALEIEKDPVLVNDSAQTMEDFGGDEPSAADYDPTVDMQEDKLRQDNYHQSDDVPATAYDETQNNNQDVLIPATRDMKPAPPKSRGEFDMFADEDANDMFAEDPTDSDHPGSANAAKAVPVARSKAIDMSMLDDFDDEDGYYKIILGELLDSRYHVQANLGKGMFSAVVRAMDQMTHRLVAIKIIRSNETM